MEDGRRFSAHMQKVLNGAKEEVQQLQDRSMGSEHLLLAMLRLPGCTAVEIMGNFDVSTMRTKELLMQKIWTVERTENLQKNSTLLPSAHLDISPDAHAVVLLAAAEAHVMGQSCIGTEHLLLGFLRESEGLAGKVLRELGLELEACRAEVMDDFMRHETDDDGEDEEETLQFHRGKND
ncbi:MAG: hypothetical protein LBC42_01765, partial [Puniceicoccales bacterium]|nr:hypothetical protein [Puniceicoccales bacterium]